MPEQHRDLSIAEVVATAQTRAELAELAAEVDSLRALVELIIGRPLPARVSPPSLCQH
jgi:hypothetical protein